MGVPPETSVSPATLTGSIETARSHRFSTGAAQVRNKCHGICQPPLNLRLMQFARPLQRLQARFRVG